MPVRTRSRTPPPHAIPSQRRMPVFFGEPTPRLLASPLAKENVLLHPALPQVLRAVALVTTCLSEQQTYPTNIARPYTYTNLSPYGAMSPALYAGGPAPSPLSMIAPQQSRGSPLALGGMMSALSPVSAMGIAGIGGAGATFPGPMWLPLPLSPRPPLRTLLCGSHPPRRTRRHLRACPPASFPTSASKQLALHG